VRRRDRSNRGREAWGRGPEPWGRAQENKTMAPTRSLRAALSAPSHPARARSRDVAGPSGGRGGVTSCHPRTHSCASTPPSTEKLAFLRTSPDSTRPVASPPASDARTAAHLRHPRPGYLVLCGRLQTPPSPAAGSGRASASRGQTPWPSSESGPCAGVGKALAPVENQTLPECGMATRNSQSGSAICSAWCRTTHNPQVKGITHPASVRRGHRPSSGVREQSVSAFGEVPSCAWLGWRRQ
jgi:hypothetical protein